jgi:hypothetical protein
VRIDCLLVIDLQFIGCTTDRTHRPAELKQLHVWLRAPIDRHRDAPRPGEDVGILDRHVVPDDVGRLQREALDQLERIAVVIAGAVEPGPIVEVRDIDH